MISVQISVQQRDGIKYEYKQQISGLLTTHLTLRPMLKVYVNQHIDLVVNVQGRPTKKYRFDNVAFFLWASSDYNNKAVVMDMSHDHVINTLQIPLY